MKVAVSQFKAKELNTFQDFEEHLEWHVNEAAKDKAELILFPEFFTSELLTLEPFLDENLSYTDIFKKYATLFTEPFKELVSRLSKKYVMTIVAGSHFVYEEKEDKYYNTCFVFHPDGQIFSQSKVHPSYELVYNKFMTSPAKDIQVTHVNGTCIGVSICYDSSFPEVSRILTDMGAEIILVPTCTLDDWGSERNQLFSKARASENQVFVLNSQLIGTIPFPRNIPYGFTFTGKSGIYSPIHATLCDPTGVIAEAKPNTEMVLIADIDVDFLKKMREKGPNQNRKDMRVDFYKKFESVE
ncbi:nitrilase-related carbon-nitrogen hydrolase [Terrilactibacillus laevilacticus]|uniref:nitrilase-related carbon-nitrogen hydrolase n=1 Tax=Terrilactibacillus laevilacticus TaxID=1380157 RepID=UPI0011469349|nr:nitrilase-related carbon-nitrogen hydrolase [Terrilactibacillus laevilacticus]